MGTITLLNHNINQHKHFRNKRWNETLETASWIKLSGHSLQESNITGYIWRKFHIAFLKPVAGSVFSTKIYSNIVRRITEERTDEKVKYRNNLVLVVVFEVLEFKNVDITQLCHIRCENIQGLFRLLGNNCDCD